MKLSKMCKIAQYVMSYGGSFHSYKNMMLYEMVRYDYVKVRRNIKKRYIKKAWQKAKYNRAIAKSILYSQRYSGSQADLLFYDDIK